MHRHAAINGKILLVFGFGGRKQKVESAVAATAPCWSPRWCGSACLWDERWSCCWGRPPPPSACWSSATAAASVNGREEILGMRVREETAKECVGRCQKGIIRETEERRWYRLKVIYSSRSRRQKEMKSFSVRQPTWASTHEPNLSIYQDSTECSELSVSNLSYHFVNGAPQGSMLPFSLCGISLKINGSQLCGRAARGDHLIQLRHPLESIGKAVRRAAQHFEEYVRLNCTCMWPSARPGKGFIVNMPGLSTGCRIKSVCTIGLGDGAHPPLNHLLCHSRSVIRCVYQSQEGARTSTRNILQKRIGTELVDEHKRDIFAF